jgi:hypothetical protein
MHARQSSWDVPPGQLAEFITLLYAKHGLRFRKINLSACDSGGDKNSPDPSDSLAMTFCKALVENLAGHCDWLNEVMVAAYRATVTFGTVEGRVRNLDPYKPIRPSPPFEHLSQLQEVSKGISEKVALLDQTNQEKLKKSTYAVANRALDKAGEAKKLFNAAKAYIGSKVAWQFRADSADSGAWARISVAAYTENEEMSNLIRVVEELYVKAMPQEKTRLKLGFVL